MLNNNSPNNYNRLDRSTYGFITITFLALFYYFAINFDNEFLRITTSVVCILWFVAATKDRFHDINKSGFYALLMFVPFINCITYVLLLIIPGTPGSNTYGPPLGTKEVSATSSAPDSSVSSKEMPSIISKDERLKQALKGNHPYKDMRIFNRI